MLNALGAIVRIDSKTPLLGKRARVTDTVKYAIYVKRKQSGRNEQMTDNRRIIRSTERSDKWIIRSTERSDKWIIRSTEHSDKSRKTTCKNLESRSR